MAPVSVDETEPLLGLGAAAEVCTRPQCHSRDYQDQGSVDFDPKGDPENPREWTKSFKWAVTLILTFMAFNVTFNCISVVPIATRIVTDLSDGGQASRYASVLLVTIWELGEAAGPLVIAPLSETFGRWPVINIANTLFILATLLAALAQTTPVFILARALSGLAVMSNVLSPAVVGDIFDPEHRGSPMSLVMVAPLVGGAVGPAISGAIAQSLSWRWALWMAAILAGTCEVLFLTCFKETYKVPILRRRAKSQRKSSREQPDAAAAKDNGSNAELLESIVRPFIVFGSSGVLMVLSLFGSVAFAHYYNMSTTLPDILESTYGLSPALTGSALICFSAGAVASVVFCNLALDAIYARMKDSHGGVGQPEFRLPIVIVGAFTLPPAIAFYGWAAHLRLPLPVLLFAVGLVGTTLMLGTLPLSAYVVDAFGLYSASAMTGLIVARCLMGTFLPLLTTPLVENFGYGWGFTILAFVSLALAPVPVVLLRYGEQWRQRCKYTRAE